MISAFNFFRLLFTNSVTNTGTYLFKVLYFTWLVMARQLESTWHPERRATISTACCPSRAFSGSIFSSSGGGTAPDKLYAAVAAATIWPSTLGSRTCNTRDNRVNAWRTVSLMDLGDNHNYNMHPRINGNPQRGNSNTVSLLQWAQ